MALWQGTSLNTNKLSSAINKWESEDMQPMVVKRNAFLYAIRGMTETENPGSVGIEKVSGISGTGINVRLLGELESFSNLPDADQVDAVTWAENTNFIGAAVFEWGHYYLHDAITEMMYREIRGNEAKTRSYVKDLLFKIQRSWEKAFGDQLNGTSYTAGQRQLIPWQVAVADDNTYGTLDRTDSGNADFQSNVVTSVGTLELDQLTSLKLDILADGGDPTFGVCAKNVFQKINALTREFAQNTGQWKRFNGGSVTEYDGIAYVFESRLSSGVLGMFDPKSWKLYLDEQGMTVGEMVDVSAWTKGIKYVLPVNHVLQMICKCPSWNGKLTGITD